ncbi:unknown protein [Mesoplasma florum L1]|uniref:DUF177 domain-containing protein n=1 Tax=Mesoplasma florum (strain ATCC 33453 / NBRC 100688 / NCTC 11704 / L1) TaxID=265311 RepID=Q6F167_MESFL|nr:YceD family protein [Mesoplasma florum]AAT75756.1 unknown protein [Mesoplasma florum L1]ATI73359.1 hypothetical protein CQZ69_02170 [Mesoplasma florum]ATI74040.1 hypothetical protein CQZ70_02130 [Mesoplasma florum]AVN61072.1 hypothetical protein CG005_02090 [Mesoplasma florum]AVN61760.1 hypothetical protein CG004_02170 [Mesoplasma florum]
MNKQYFEKQVHTELTEIINDLESIKLNNILVKKVKYLDYDIDVDWISSIETVAVNGIINFTLDAIDSRTGEEFEYSDSIDWNDEYSFSDSINDQANIIVGEEFDVQNYVIEQININLPFNLSNNSDIIKKTGFGWTIMSEEEFHQNEQNKVDHRWDKLNEFMKK